MVFTQKRKTARWKITWKGTVPRMLLGEKRMCNPTNEGLLTRLVRITEPQGDKGWKSYRSALPSEAWIPFTIFHNIGSSIIRITCRDLLKIQIFCIHSRWTKLESQSVCVCVCVYGGGVEEGQGSRGWAYLSFHNVSLVWKTLFYFTIFPGNSDLL